MREPLGFEKAFNVQTSVSREPRLASLIQRIEKASAEYNQMLENAAQKVTALHNVPSNINTDAKIQHDEQRTDALGVLESFVGNIERGNTKMQMICEALGEVV